MKVTFGRMAIVPISFVIGHSAHAQSWCPPGAQWVIDEASPWSTSQAHYIYAGDTLIDGFISQKIERTFFTMFSGSPVTSTEGSPLFTRYDGAVIWRWYDGAAWDTVLWVGASPGDQWEPTWDWGNDCNDRFVVTDTGMTLIDGLWLRRITVEPHDSLGAPLGGAFDLIERVSPLFWFMSISCPTIYESWVTGTCYSDVAISYPDSGATCSITLTAGGRFDRPFAQAYPDPVIDQVTFALDGKDLIQGITVLDMYGRRVAFERPFTTSVTLDLSRCAPGAYIWSAEGVHGSTRSVLIKR